MKKFPWDKKYLYWGVTALCVVGCSLLLYTLLTAWPSVRANFRFILTILNPVIWGFIIAYLLNPIVRFFELNIFQQLNKKPARIASLALALLITFTVLVTLLWMILPQVYASLLSIMTTAPDYVIRVTDMIGEFLQNAPELENALISAFGNLSDALLNWLSSRIPQLQEFITGVSSGLMTFLRAVANIAIGFIFASYLLVGKETFKAQTKKVLYSIFDSGTVQSILHALTVADGAFTGFISGKLLDSLIIGVICYICMTIMGMPYVALISVIVGVTNIIPFFGPFIGAVPSALLILMVSPWKCLGFIIFILVLQQIDGNIIGPRILSGTVGLNGFWIIFAIIVGSGLFGLPGMIVGVPVFTLMYTAARWLVAQSLIKRGMSPETADYMDSTDKAAQSVEAEDPSA